MMGTSSDPGRFMGNLWVSAPGPRVSPDLAARYRGQIPVGACVSRASRTITFTASDAALCAGAWA